MIIQTNNNKQTEQTHKNYRNINIIYKTAIIQQHIKQQQQQIQHNRIYIIYTHTKNTQLKTHEETQTTTNITHNKQNQKQLQKHKDIQKHKESHTHNHIHLQIKSTTNNTRQTTKTHKYA